MNPINNQDFYCNTHDNHFWHVCIPCLDDIFHQGFGIQRQEIEELIANEEWDMTYNFIDSL